MYWLWTSAGLYVKILATGKKEKREFEFEPSLTTPQMLSNQKGRSGLEAATTTAKSSRHLLRQVGKVKNRLRRR